VSAVSPHRQILPGPAPLEESGVARPFAPAPGILDALIGGDGSGREALARGEALCVVTGQQPGFPLPLGLSLQKAATAIAQADRLSEQSGRAVLPLFWNAADDSDFDEARGQMLARPGAPPLSIRLPGELARKGGFVGDLPVAAAYRDFATLLAADTLPADWSLPEGEDLGGQQGRIIAELFRPWGLLVLDARSPSLRLAAHRLFLDYAERRSEFAALLDETGEMLKSELGERPLRKGLGERALFFLKRRRRVLPTADDYGEELATRLAARPVELSPNAALRPLVQDFILPVAAAVLGPAEWNYHRQLRPTFDLMDLRFPAALPRLAAAWGGDFALGLNDRGRFSSPLARPGHPLGDPAGLVALAHEHLSNWDKGDLVALELAHDGEEGV
jgi:bacillithiol synthase